MASFTCVLCTEWQLFGFRAFELPPPLPPPENSQPSLRWGTSRPPWRSYGVQWTLSGQPLLDIKESLEEQRADILTSPLDCLPPWLSSGPLFLDWASRSFISSFYLGQCSPGGWRQKLRVGRDSQEYFGRCLALVLPLSGSLRTPGVKHLLLLVPDSVSGNQYQAVVLHLDHCRPVS